ncbi:MAG: hypothetical protein KatS3mg083_462 [Candidatus Dojkabacteria bacterium]|nr:MAG: hypothetical protein KatS3mg083_462 [Candidatus Dojkabacteria bacterium]
MERDKPSTNPTNSDPFQQLLHAIYADLHNKNLKHSEHTSQDTQNIKKRDKPSTNPTNLDPFQQLLHAIYADLHNKNPEHIEQTPTDAFERLIAIGAISPMPNSNEHHFIQKPQSQATTHLAQTNYRTNRESLEREFLITLCHTYQIDEGTERNIVQLINQLTMRIIQDLMIILCFQPDGRLTSFAEHLIWQSKLSYITEDNIYQTITGNIAGVYPFRNSNILLHILSKHKIFPLLPNNMTTQYYDDNMQNHTLEITSNINNLPKCILLPFLVIIDPLHRRVTIRDHKNNILGYDTLGNLRILDTDDNASQDTIVTLLHPYANIIPYPVDWHQSIQAIGTNNTYRHQENLQGTLVLFTTQ